MKFKKSRKNRLKKSKKGAGLQYEDTPDIENQLDNVKYENTPDIENQLNKETNVNIDKYTDTTVDPDIDIDKPKNIVEYVPEQKETSIQPIEEDIELNIPSDKRIDLGDSGYGIYDTQFYGGSTKKRIPKRMKNKSKRKKNTSKRKKKRPNRRSLKGFKIDILKNSNVPPLIKN